MANNQADKQPAPNKDDSPPADSRPATPAKQAPGAGAEQAAVNQKRGLESGEENTT